MTFVRPEVTLCVVSVLVAWYLVLFAIFVVVVHPVWALAGPKMPWRCTGPLRGIAELVLGVWAVSFWQRSLLTSVVGVSAICLGANEVFAAFMVRLVARAARRPTSGAGAVRRDPRGETEHTLGARGEG